LPNNAGPCIAESRKSPAHNLLSKYFIFTFFGGMIINSP
jgi:hypothetical protein